MRRFRNASYLLPLVCLLFTAPANSRGEAQDESPGSDLPQPVLRILEEAYPGATIEAVDEGTEDDVRLFEIEVLFEEKEYELTISEEGSILETEEEVELEALPLVLREVLQRVFSRAELLEIDRVISGEGTIYEIELEIEGEPAELEFLPSGEVIGIQGGSASEEEEESAVQRL